MRELADLIAGLLYIIAFIPYVLAIWRTRKMPSGAHGKIQPAKASWTVWAILDTIVFAGMYAEKSLNGQIIGAVIGIWVVVFLSLKCGQPGWKKRDKICLGIGIAGLVFWKLSNNPEFGILFSLISMFIAAYPTFKEAWEDPSHEDKFTWIIFSIACVFALIAVPKWTIAHAGLPITAFIIDVPIAAIIYFRSLKLKVTNR